MYCLIQFYVQLRNTPQLSPNRPFLKILAIKLVIFLSFWQSTAISVGTSTLSVIQPNEILAYPDIKVGIPSLALCVEMACFALLHLWAFPWSAYDSQNNMTKWGGFWGTRALWDAINIWDVVKGFGRGMRWICVGVHQRRQDSSYMSDDASSGRGKRRGFDNVANTQYSRNLGMSHMAGSSSTQHLPIASEFRSSVWYDRRHQFRQQLGLTPYTTKDDPSYKDSLRSPSRDESAGLIQNAQTPGLHSPSPYTPRSPLSSIPSSPPYPAPVSPGPPRPHNNNTNFHSRDISHQTHQTHASHPSVSSMGTESLKQLSNEWTASSRSDVHNERRPSYVSMDEELYTATAATAPTARPGQGFYGAWPQSGPGLRPGQGQMGGRSLT